MAEENNDKNLYAQLAEANAESKARKAKIRKLTENNSTLQAELDELRTERDNLAKKLEAQPDELRTENEKLRGELRTIKHKTAFSEAAKSLGANECALDDLWAVSGYQADADEVDANALQGLLQATLAAKPYFRAIKSEEAPGQSQKAPQQPLNSLTAGLGLARGSVDSGNVAHTYRQSELTKILSNPNKRDAYLDAFAKGQVTILPD